MMFNRDSLKKDLTHRTTVILPLAESSLALELLPYHIFTVLAFLRKLFALLTASDQKRLKNRLKYNSQLFFLLL